jgi:adenylate kinase
MTIKGPVIVITGTPGTGKSSLSALLASQSQVPLRHIDVGQYVKEQGLYDLYDEEWQSYTADEDRVRITWLLRP